MTPGAVRLRTLQIPSAEKTDKTLPKSDTTCNKFLEKCTKSVDK